MCHPTGHVLPTGGCISGSHPINESGKMDIYMEKNETELLSYVIHKYTKTNSDGLKI